MTIHEELAALRKDHPELPVLTFHGITEGCMAECHNELYHYRVMVGIFPTTDGSVFHGQVTESFKGGIPVGSRTYFCTEGFTKLP